MVAEFIIVLGFNIVVGFVIVVEFLIRLCVGSVVFDTALFGIFLPFLLIFVLLLFR